MRKLHAATLVLLLLALVARVSADSWVVAPGETQTVGFRSKAPLESFEGSTHTVTGVITLDPEALGDEVAIEVRVDLTSIDTGISMRDRHMRENHLHTDRFPHATFRADSVTGGTGAVLTDGALHEVTVAGELDLHGVKRPVSVVLGLRMDEDRALHITSGFPVALADHDIPRPQFLFAKLGEVQQVFVKLEATIPTE
jgi:polyisoprenoid-binding protein YceI